MSTQPLAGEETGTDPEREPALVSHLLLQHAGERPLQGATIRAARRSSRWTIR